MTQDWSQPFLPPQDHLVGGFGAWDQNMTQRMPFSSPLSGDLYNNMAKPFPMIGDWSNRSGQFSVSAMGNPNREQAAADSWQQRPDWQAASLPGSSFMQNNPLAPNASSFSPAYNPMTQGPQYGAGAAWQNAANTSPTSPFAPPAGFAPPSMSVGGMNLSWSQMSPDIQKQIFAATGGTMGSKDSVADATEALTKISKVLRDDLIPASKDYVEQITRTADVMRGGNGRGGGGFDGGITPYDGEFNSTGWFDPVRPGVMDQYGYGKGMPRFDDREAESKGFGQWMQPNQIMRGLRGANLANRFFIQPAMNAEDDYRSQMATQDIMGVQAGMMNYNDLMSGQYGQLMRRNVNAQERQLAFGKQVDMAYGGWADMAVGASAARGPLGAAAGIGLPALGVGLGAASFLGGPVGLAAGAITAIVGAEGYAESAAYDPYEIGRWQTARDRGERVGVDTFKGAIGQGVQTARALVGTASNADRNIRANAKDYFNNVNSFAAGDMSTAELKGWAQQNNFNPASAVGQGIDTFIETNTAYGWTREQQSSVLSLDLMYAPQRMPKANQMFGMQMALGGEDYAQFMQKFLPSAGSAMGVNPSDQAGMSNLMNMYTSNMYQVQQAGGNVGLYQQSLFNQIQPVGQINQARYRAGYGSVMGLDYYSNLASNPYIQSDVQGIDAAKFGFQGTDPGFAQSISDPLYNRASYYSRSGRPDVSGRMQGMIPQLKDKYYQAFAYGEDATQALRGYAQEAALSPENGAMIGLIGSGDRMALSQNAGRLGDIRYQTIDVNTGMSSMYAGMSKEWYGAMRQDQSGLFRLSYDQAQVGTRGMEDHLRDMSRGLDQYQYNQQTASRNIGYQMMTGGAGGVNGQGFAIGGDNLNNLASLFQAQGMAFNAGNGMGQWQVEDAQTSLSREQQQYRMNQSTAGLGIAGIQRELANRQWNESFAMNQQQFSVQTAYQSQNMTIDRSQQITQSTWQNQDLALNRNQMELQYGWQMEDADRNIRFARGRQRVDLMREQARSTIMHSLDETQQGNQEERAKTVQQWNKEEFDRKKEYFDTSKQLAQQEMELNKRHHDEKMGLDLKSFELQKDQNEKEKQWMTQQWGLEDQRRLLTRQDDELQYKMATDMAITVKSVTDESNKYKDAIVAIGREYDENNAKLSVAVNNMTLLGQAVDAFNGKSVNSIFSTPTPPPMMRGGNAKPAFKEGGSTGQGDSNQVAGVTHYNEYVVPEGGALVMKGGENLVPYLERMIALLERGIINATIYTNAGNAISTRSLSEQALTRIK